VSVDAILANRGELVNQRILFSAALAFNDKPETCEEAARRRQNSPAADLGPAVLVADDEVLIRSTIIEILRSEGYGRCWRKGRRGCRAMCEQASS
jgi:hypothetical protein